MKRVAIFVVMIVAVMGMGTAWAEDNAAIWKSFSKESKIIYISGYLNGATSVCYSENGKFLKEKMCYFFTKYEPNMDSVISLIDSIYTKEKYRGIPVRSAIFISFGVDSKLINYEVLLKFCDKAADLKEKEAIVDSLLN